MPEELGERTESPSGRKLSDARAKGRIAKSADLSAAVDLFGAFLLIALLGSGLIAGLTSILASLLGGRSFGPWASTDSLAGMLSWTADKTARVAAPFLLLMFLVVVLAQFVQVGWLYTLEPLKPNLSRLNPLAGMKRLTGRRNFVKTGISLLKLALIGGIAASVIASSGPKIAALPAMSAPAAFMMTVKIVLHLALWILAVMLIIGLADFAFQKWQHTQDLKMTRQEVKEERRSMEGDADLKARRLRLARQMALQRIRQAVPTADVIVTNPTHFAVAIKYDAASMESPKVVAKGADFMAFRIREVAVASGVPIVEKPALARALYAGVEVGRHISPEFYQAVAEILAYVYRIEAGGTGVPPVLVPA